jgi:hypothetical protein
MPDRDRTLNTDPDRTLAAALRALPDAAPQPDLWPDLARELAARKRPRIWRYALPAALAASVLLALLLPRAATPPSTPVAGVAPATTPVPNTAAPDTTAAAARDELDSLRTRSQTLERWVAAVAAHAPQNSRDLMAAVEVEDLIGLVDLQLGATRDRADALPLWRQRVVLLEDLATIRGSAFAIAASDIGANAVDTSFNRIN